MLKSLTLVAIFTQCSVSVAQDTLIDLNLRDPFDSKCRLLLTKIDQSFMKWAFKSDLHWTDSAGSHTSHAGIVLNKTELESLSRQLAPMHSWIPITFVLGHEKAHLLQSKLYPDAERYPAVVRELQADIMAATVCSNEIFKFEWVPGPNGTMVPEGQATETDATKFQDARIAEMLAVVTLGQRLGTVTARSGEHPEQWERGCAAQKGLMVSLASLQIAAGQSNIQKFRSDLGWSPIDDFASASLREAYKIAGIRYGTMGQNVLRSTLENADDDIGVALRTGVDAAMDMFASVKTLLFKEDEAHKYYEANLFMPDFQSASVDISKEDPGHAELRFFATFPNLQSSEVASAIFDVQYQGFEQRISRLLKNGWTDDGPDNTATGPFHSWTRRGGPCSVTVLMKYVSKPRSGKPNMFIKIIRDPPALTASFRSGPANR